MRDFHGAFDPPPAIIETIIDSSDEIGLFGGYIKFPDLDRDSMPPNELFENTADATISEEDAQRHAWSDQFIDEVEPSTCKRYLDRKMDKHIQCKWDFVSMPLDCPVNTIAARIESAFYSHEIDTSLRKAIEDRCSLLTICLERRNSIKAENKKTLFSGWDRQHGDNSVT